MRRCRVFVDSTIREKLIQIHCNIVQTINTKFRNISSLKLSMYDLLQDLSRSISYFFLQTQHVYAFLVELAGIIFQN